MSEPPKLWTWTEGARCAQVTLPSQDITDPAAWPEVINKLKESIVTAFDGAIHDREEEVKRGEAQRTTVGWNFCTWFLLKVGCWLYTQVYWTNKR